MTLLILHKKVQAYRISCRFHNTQKKIQNLFLTGFGLLEFNFPEIDHYFLQICHFLEFVISRIFSFLAISHFLQFLISHFSFLKNFSFCFFYFFWQIVGFKLNLKKNKKTITIDYLQYVLCCNFEHYVILITFCIIIVAL